MGKQFKKGNPKRAFRVRQREADLDPVLSRKVSVEWFEEMLLMAHDAVGPAMLNIQAFVEAAKDEDGENEQEARAAIVTGVLRALAEHLGSHNSYPTLHMRAFAHHLSTLSKMENAAIVGNEAKAQAELTDMMRSTQVDSRPRERPITCPVCGELGSLLLEASDETTARYRCKGHHEWVEPAKTSPSDQN